MSACRERQWAEPVSVLLDGRGRPLAAAALALAVAVAAVEWSASTMGKIDNMEGQAPLQFSIAVFWDYGSRCRGRFVRAQHLLRDYEVEFSRNRSYRCLKLGEKGELTGFVLPAFDKVEKVFK